MQILILSRKPELYSVRRLAEEILRRGASPIVRDPEAEDILKERPDAVIGRFGSYRFEDSLKTQEFFERRQIPCLNKSTSYRDARNKWICALTLQDHDLPVPWTRLAVKSERPSVYPVVLKPVDGSQGEGVHIVRSAEEWMALPLQREWVVQEFIPEAEGRDLRILVSRNGVIASMERKAADGDFRANLHLGGTASPVQATGQELEYARQALKALRLDVAGIDIIRSKKGPLLLEVNPCPGFEGLEKVSGVDVAAAMLDLLAVPRP